MCLTTVPNVGVATSLAQGLLQDRLVACVTQLPEAQSHYWWQGAITSTSEIVLLIKTSEDRIVDLKHYLSTHHPYQTPELLVLAVQDGLEAYLDWVQQETRP